MLISDWSSDVCSSDLNPALERTMAENIAHFTDAHTVLQRYVAEVRERLFVPKQIEREEEWHISIAELATLDPQLFLLYAFFRPRSEEQQSELQSLMCNYYAVFCLKKKKYRNRI